MPKNPFPGMNPYLQQHWGDVHSALIAYIREAISGELPDDLSARMEERITVASEDREKPADYRADVGIVETWKSGFPQLWQPGDEGTIAVAEPIIFHDEPETQRYIQIGDAHGRIVTVIEVLSPANKREEGRAAYVRKQQDFLAGGVNLVEIDLVRGGARVTAVSTEALSFPPGTCHHICVARQYVPGMRRREVYLCPLREPLPAIRVPLRVTDPDVPLALQPLIDRCYQAGRYWLGDPKRPLDPPLPPEDAAWAEDRLRTPERA